MKTKGVYKSTLSRNSIILVDVDSRIRLHKESLIYIYNSEGIIDIVSLVSFKVEDKDVEFV